MTRILWVKKRCLSNVPGLSLTRFFFWPRALKYLRSFLFKSKKLVIPIVTFETPSKSLFLTKTQIIYIIAENSQQFDKIMMIFTQQMCSRTKLFKSYISSCCYSTTKTTSCFSEFVVSSISSNNNICKLFF